MNSAQLDTFNEISLQKLDKLSLLYPKIDTAQSIPVSRDDPYYLLDHIICFMAGIIGGLISSSNDLANKLQEIHNDASLDAPQKYKRLGMLFHHMGDNIDKYCGDYIKRNGQQCGTYLHRLYFGHDVFSLGPDNPFYVLTSQYGIRRGILQAVRHIAADTLTKTGIPLPFSSFLDYQQDGKLYNWLDDAAKALVRDKNHAEDAFELFFNNNTISNNVNVQAAYGRALSIRAQDIMSQGITWGILKAYIRLRQIDDEIYESQLKLVGYSTSFYSNAIIGFIKTGVPFINWATLSMTLKELFTFLRLNRKDIERLCKSTDQLIQSNIALSREVYSESKYLKSFDNHNEYIGEICAQYESFNNLSFALEREF